MLAATTEEEHHQENGGDFEEAEGPIGIKKLEVIIIKDDERMRICFMLYALFFHLYIGVWDKCS